MTRSTRRTFLKSASSVALLPSLTSFARTTAEPDEESPLILHIVVGGGWDPTLVFDNKIGVSSAAQETGTSKSSPSETFSFVDHSSRPSVKSFFSSYYENATIINGIHVPSVNHDLAMNYMTTVVTADRHLKGSGRRSDFLTLFSAITNPSLRYPHVAIDVTSAGGGGAPLRVVLKNESISDYAAARTGTFSARREAAMETALQRKWSIALSDAGKYGLDVEKVQRLALGLSRETELYDKIPDYLSDIGSTSTTFERNAKLALMYMSSGSTLCASVGHQTRIAWDSHTNHYATQSALFESLFADLIKIMQFADSKSLLSKLILVVSSEMGRAPFLNGDSGKDHWPTTSALVWSKLTKGNQVVGATDDYLRAKKIDLSTGQAATSGGTLLQMSHIWNELTETTSLPIGEIVSKKAEKFSVLRKSE